MENYVLCLDTTFSFFFAVTTSYIFFFKLSTIFFVSYLGTHNFNKTQFMSSNIFSIPEYLCNTQHIDQKKIKLQTKTCDHRIAQARKKVHKSDLCLKLSLLSILSIDWIVFLIKSFFIFLQKIIEFSD